MDPYQIEGYSKKGNPENGYNLSLSTVRGLRHGRTTIE
jgi:hypothetical protein